MPHLCGVLAQHVFALGLRLGGLRQFCGELGVLPVRATDLQRHGELQRHHVGVGDSPLAVHELYRPVRMAIGAGHLSPSAGELLAPLERENLRMVGEFRIERVLVQGDRVDRRLSSQRAFRRLTNPSCKGELCAANLARCIGIQVFGFG